MLTVLGATAAEDHVYRLLATVISASEDEIADANGLSPDEVRTALVLLIERGLVDRLPETPTRYVAVSPAVVESMLSDRLAELRTAQETLDGLAPRYRAGSIARTGVGVFEIVRGRHALRRHSLGLMRSARSEVLVLAKEPFIAFEPGEQLDRPESVRNRIVYETPLLAQPELIDRWRTDPPGPEEARVHTKLPVKALVVDRSVAMLPLAQDDTTPVGVLVRESAVLDAVLTLFEYVWESALPLPVHGNGDGGAAMSDLPDDQRELVTLLLAGLCDEAIAMQRGTSVRTVQRKVHALMDLANVQTRMQLGWEAARREWV
jgi:sugar-specific transcriptional regulator TrmB